MVDIAERLSDDSLVEHMGDPRFRVAAARRILARNGCESLVAGHVSIRDGDTLWTSPFEFFDETTPGTVVRADFDLNAIEGTGDISPALDFHAAIYRCRLDVNCVIHIHSHWVSVFSTVAREVGMYNVGSVVFYGEQGLLVDDGTTPPVEGHRVVAALGAGNSVLIQNHGAILAGPSIETTTVLAIMLERAARYHVEAEMIGGFEIAEAEVLRGKASYHKYFVPEMWHATLRRLRVSDPELFTYR